MKLKCSGIYKIVCISTYKLYVGSSNNISMRWSTHKSKLKKNKHANRYLQNAWNKYGEDSFAITVIEKCEESILQKREQFWLKKLRPFNHDIGFNILSCSDSIRGLCDLNSKEYIVTLPDKTEILVKNLSKFSRQNGILGGGLYHVARGEINKIHGFTARYANESKADWLAKRKRGLKPGGGHKGFWIITHPNGKRERILSLTKFCKNFNLSQGNMTEVANGKRKQHKGFKCEKI